MATVRSVLHAKGHDIWSIAPDAPVYKALKLMADKNVGALLVLDKGEWVGILSERDYARKVELRGVTASDTAVSQIMTTKVVCVSPDQTLQECMALMTEKRIRHLPVQEGDQLIGLVSIGDVVKNLIVEQEHLIKQLENYIVGR